MQRQMYNSACTLCVCVCVRAMFDVLGVAMDLKLKQKKKTPLVLGWVLSHMQQSPFRLSGGSYNLMPMVLKGTIF